MSTRQLGLLLVLLCAITLTLAWIIERRQILSFRSELDAWGAGAVDPPPSAAVSPPSAEPASPDPRNPMPAPPSGDAAAGQDSEAAG